MSFGNADAQVTRAEYGMSFQYETGNVDEGDIGISVSLVSANANGTLNVADAEAAVAAFLAAITVSGDLTYGGTFRSYPTFETWTPDTP